MSPLILPCRFVNLSVVDSATLATSSTGADAGAEEDEDDASDEVEASLLNDSGAVKAAPGPSVATVVALFLILFKKAAVSSRALLAWPASVS